MMHRRTAILLAGILVAATIAAAVVLLGPPRVPLTRSPTDVDHVTLYQNGLAFVELTRNFTSSGDRSLLVIPLPLSARLDSLRVEGEGVTLREVRGAGEEDGSLQLGDTLVVHTEDGRSHRGSYAGRQGSQLVLATEEGAILVEGARITAIEVSGRGIEDEAAASTEALALVEAPAGSHAVRVSYLAMGPGWTPSYELNVDTGRLLFRATLTGLDDWRNVTLDLVSGSPHVVMHPIPPPIPLAFKAELATDARVADDVGRSVPLGELHRYRYAAPLSVSRGESVRLLVEAGDAEIVERRLDVEANAGFGGGLGSRQEVTVFDRLELRNTLPEPLPGGILLAYSNGTWIGEDILQPTPKGERANLTLATSEDVVARITLERAESNGSRDVSTYALSVTNRKDSPATVHAVMVYPTFRTSLLSAEPTPDESAGGRVGWTRELAAGASDTFRIRYETTRT